MLTSDPPIITQTNTQTAADQERFIATNLDRLAYFGYAHYREEGKGLIALFPEEFTLREGRLGREPLWYLPGEAIMTFIDRMTGDGAARPSFLQVLRETLTSYNPIRSLVIGFLAQAPLTKGQRINLYMVDRIDDILRVRFGPSQLILGACLLGNTYHREHHACRPAGLQSGVHK